MCPASGGPWLACLSAFPSHRSCFSPWNLCSVGAFPSSDFLSDEGSCVVWATEVCEGIVLAVHELPIDCHSMVDLVARMDSCVEAISRPLSCWMRHEAVVADWRSVDLVGQRCGP